MAASNARSGLSPEDGEESEGVEGGGEESEGEEQEENEEENSDEDYPPPGDNAVEFEAANVDLRTAAGVSDSRYAQSEAESREGSVNVDMTEGRGSVRRAGDEVIDVSEDSENEPLKVGAGGAQKEKVDESCTGQSVSSDPDLLLPNCPICMERWAGEGVHRVCCIPCGHLYGRSCLERWVRRCGASFAKCPQCKKSFKVKEIINLYAPQVAVLNDDLEKELSILRQKNESLNIERKKLLDEVNKLKKDAEDYTQLKKACIRHVFPGAVRMTPCDLFNESRIHSLQGSSFLYPNTGQEGHFFSGIVLQDELQFDGARVLDIDASSHVLLISGKSPGWRGGHALTKVSLLCPYAVQSIPLPEDTGAVRDLHFSPADAVLPGRLALLASLGKKLSVFSMESNNIVLKYNLPGPAWSCSWDSSASYHIYAGLQNGMLLMFDIRQTSSPLESRPGLSVHPIHTIHPLPPQQELRAAGGLLTASAVGPCLWDAGGDETSPRLLPETENQGVCISLACGGSGADAVASFRPRVHTGGEAAGSGPSQTPPPAALTGPVRLGTHVLLKRLEGGSFRQHEAASGNVSDVRMCRSAIVRAEGGGTAFVYGDEASHGLCVWDLPSFQVVQRLKPHEHPILDVKFSKYASEPGLLGCISENKIQVFRVP